MKAVFEGWADKRLGIDRILRWHADEWDDAMLCLEDVVFKGRDDESAWPDEAWPPLRVRVTVEIEEEPK